MAFNQKYELVRLEPVSFDDLDKLTQGGAEKKLGIWMKHIGEPIFGDFSGDTEEASLLALRNTISSAMNLRELIDSNNFSREKLQSQRLITKNFVDDDLCETFHFEEAPDGFVATLSLSLGGMEYSLYVERGIETLKKNSSLEELISRPVLSVCEGQTLKLSRTYARKSGNMSNNMRTCCIDILDELSAIHLHDMTVKTEAGVPYLLPSTIVSKLWFCLTEGFREGQVILCGGCGRPIIVNKKSGEQRKTCNDACRKKKSRILQGSSAE